MNYIEDISSVVINYEIDETSLSEFSLHLTLCSLMDFLIYIATVSMGLPNGTLRGHM